MPATHFKSVRTVALIVWKSCVMLKQLVDISYFIGLTRNTLVILFGLKKERQSLSEAGDIFIPVQKTAMANSATITDNSQLLIILIGKSRNLGIFPFRVRNIVKSLKESKEMSVRDQAENHYWMAVMFRTSDGIALTTDMILPWKEIELYINQIQKRHHPVWFQLI